MDFDYDMQREMPEGAKNGYMDEHMGERIDGHVGNNSMKPIIVELPYPKVELNCKNMYWAKLLQEDYAGAVSELTAITQYIYGDTVLAEKYKEISNTLICIAIAEMKHLDMLADTIFMLGGNPKFLVHDCKKPKNWTPDYINYQMSMCNILLTNIQAEKSAIAQYKIHICKIDNEQIRELLTRIIMDEELHIEVLSELYAKYCCKK